MKLVTYSGKMDIGGSGIGTTAWRQVKPLLDEGLIKHIYAPESKQKPEGMFTVVPSISGPYFFQDTFFDAIVSQIMEYPEILQTWASHCLFQLREFPEATSIVNLYSAHPIVQAKVIGTENVNPVLAKKVIKELEICDHIFIPSDWILSSLKIVGLEHKAKLIPFGVDLEKFTPKKEKQDDTFRVIYVGSNWIRKGLIYLIQSWIDLDLKNAELTIAGVEKLPDKLMKKLPENINIGWIPDLAEKYRQSDIFVLPALEDGCPLCVGGNTIIPTIDKAFFISENLLDSKALSKDGMYHTIIKRHKRIVDHYYKFKISKCLPLSTSEDHEFWATEDSRFLINKYKNPNLSWYRADELKEGNFVTIPIPKSKEEFPIIDLTRFDDNVLYDEKFVWYKSGFSPNKKISYSDIAKKTDTTKKTVEALVRKLRKGKKVISKKQKRIFKYMKAIDYEFPVPKKYKRYIEIDDNLLWVFGWYIAEGSSHKRVKFSLGINDEAYIERIKNTFKNKFEEELIEERPKNKPNSINLYCNSKIHSIFFKKWFGDGAYHKKVPKELMLGLNKLVPLAHSLVLGDGHIEDGFNGQGQISFCTTSKTLIFQLWMILLNQKVLGGLSCYLEKSQYFLKLTGRSFYRFMKKVKMNVYIPNRIGSDEIFLDDYVLIPIRGIQKINEETTLYDIEVDKEHSFVGNGCLLHNCTYEAMASGLPVIVSSNTGTKQHVFEGMQGFIVPPSDVKELSERIQYFYDNPELVKKMGRNARKMAEAFPWERHEQEYVKWIKSL